MWLKHVRPRALKVSASADRSLELGTWKSTSIPLPWWSILPSLGSYPLSVTSFQTLTPNRRLPLLQVLHGPAQTFQSIPQQRSPLFSSLVPPEMHCIWVLLPAVLPLGVFSAFFPLLLQKPLPGGNSSPVQTTSSWDPALSAAVCGHIAHSRTCNSTIGSKVTLAVSFPAGQWGLWARARMAWPKISQAASSAMKCLLFIAADYC